MPEFNSSQIATRISELPPPKAPSVNTISLYIPNHEQAECRYEIVKTQLTIVQNCKARVKPCQGPSIMPSLSMHARQKTDQAVIRKKNRAVKCEPHV